MKAASGKDGPEDPACRHSKREHPPFVALFLIWRLHKKPQYGYSLLKEIREMAVGRKKTSTIYMVLNKLEENGLVSSRVEKVGARARRFYQTTAKGWEMFEKVRKKKIHGHLREFLRVLAR